MALRGKVGGKAPTTVLGGPLARLARLPVACTLKKTFSEIAVMDIGGTNVKMLAFGQDIPRRFPSGKTMTPLPMVNGVLEAVKDWACEAITIGDRGPVLDALVAPDAGIEGPATAPSS